MNNRCDAESSAPIYHLLLLRLWQESDGAPWRYSVQTTDGGSRVGFATFEALVAYLQQLHNHPVFHTSSEHTTIDG